MKKIKKFHLNDFSSLTNKEMIHIVGGETNGTYHEYSIVCPVGTYKRGETISCKGDYGTYGETWIKCVFNEPYQSYYSDCNGNKYIWGYLAS